MAVATRPIASAELCLVCQSEILSGDASSASQISSLGRYKFGAGSGISGPNALARSLL